MEIIKMQGLGNDFVFLNGVQNIPPQNLRETAQKMCDRHFGIGADGLVIILPSKVADIKMVIYNSDGSEAEMCGNAIRCFAKYVYEKGLVSKESFTVETLAGIMVPLLILEDDGVKAVTVDMGEPKLKRADVPILGSGERAVNEKLRVLDTEFRITALLLGVPHCVIFVDDVERFDLFKYGPAIERNPIFPRKTNVHFIEVINDQELKMRVWERGAGPTLACGTGACGSLVAAVLNGKCQRRAKLHLPGGILEIEWADNNHVYMTGPAQEVFSGVIRDRDLII